MVQSVNLDRLKIFQKKKKQRLIRLIWSSKRGVYLLVCLSLCVIECSYVCVCAVACAYICVYVFYVMTCILTYLHVFPLFVDGMEWDEARECEKRRVGEGGGNGLLQIEFSFSFQLHGGSIYVYFLIFKLLCH